MSKIVSAEGPLKCLMAIVGEAPGADEELIGRPVVGSAGAILDHKLHQCDIARQECYITNVVKVRPPKNDFSIFWTGRRPTLELLEWRGKLIDELSTLDTNIIVALGANALWALTGQSQIGKWRGSILSTTLKGERVVKVIGSYHPAAMLREWNMGPILQLDLMRAKEEAKSPELNLPQRTYLIAPTANDVYNEATNLIQADEVSFDIETSPNFIECISFAYKEDRAISIPLTPHYWGGITNLRQILIAIEAILRSPGEKIGQNISYDIQYLIRFHHILPSKPWFDTMLAQHSCYSEMPKGLDFLASIYTREPYYKDDLKIWIGKLSSIEKLWEYNAKDSAVTLEVKHKLEKELSDLNAWHTYNFAMSLLEPLLFMMLRGVKVDKEITEKHYKEYQLRIDDLRSKFKEKFGDINPRSSKQIFDLAYNKLKLKPVTRKGKATTDAKAIEKLAITSPALALVAKIRSEETIVSNYLKMQLDKIDERLRCSFNSTGTETRRLSSSKSVFGSGRNLQNFPIKLRDIVVADEGKLLTEPDLSGAESRVVAYLSNDIHGIRIFESGGNIHRWTASIIWKMSEDEIEQDKKICEQEGRDTESKYFMTKKLRHSVEKYGSWVTVSEQLRITAAKAKLLIDKFYELNPNLLNWFRTVETKLSQTRTITTPFGDKRIFYGRFGHQMVKDAVAHIAQDTVGKVINTGIVRIYNTLCKEYEDIEILLQVHDSVLIQHNEDRIDFIKEQLPLLMDVEIPLPDGKFFHIPIDVRSGKNWRDLK